MSGSGAGPSVYEVLDQLAAIDRVLDIAQSSKQLKVILFLGANGPSPSNVIASGLGESRKAVLDALRRLRVKGLVRVEEARAFPGSAKRYKVYRLTEEGLRYVRLLNGVLSRLAPRADGAARVRQEPDGVPAPARHVRDHSLARALRSVEYVYYAIEALAVLAEHGYGRGSYFTVEWLAGKLGVPASRLRNYLDPFVSGPPEEEGAKLFRRVYSPSTGRVYLQLTDAGLAVLRRLSAIYDARTRAKPFLRLASAVTGSRHPYVALARFVKAYGVLMTLGLLAYLLTGASAVLPPLAAFSFVLSLMLARE